MDYDQTDIPAVYDRGRDHGPEVRDLWMTTIASYLEQSPVARIVDLGCGTGRFTGGLSARFNVAVIGIDPSKKMLARARIKPADGRIHYVDGCAEAIPLAPQSVDIIFISMCFHHFNDRGLATRECRRVLREGGHVFVRTGLRERISSYPHVPFFPSTRPMLEEHLPPAAGVRRTFEAAGLRQIAWDVVNQTIAPSWSAYADKLALGADSIIARLSPNELERGLAAIRQRGMEEDRDITEPIDLLVFQ
jgi:ubiquinone/menaquinone biosynthesis C-methylase UbiE